MVYRSTRIQILTAKTNKKSCFCLLNSSEDKMADTKCKQNKRHYPKYAHKRLTIIRIICQCIKMTNIILHPTQTGRKCNRNHRTCYNKHTIKFVFIQYSLQIFCKNNSQKTDKDTKVKKETLLSLPSVTKDQVGYRKSLKKKSNVMPTYQ